MNKNDCFNLGHITKTSGIKGEVVFYLDVDDPSHYRKLDSLFIELNGQLIPFFIESLQLRKNAAVVKLEGIDSAERAADLVKAQLWLPLSLLPPLKGTKFYFHEVIGFAVIDNVKGNIGTVEKVLDFPQQEILQVKNGEKEILVPVLKHIVKKVDRSAKVIEIEAPEGLIDLYLGSREETPEDDDEEQD
jgi:16S rRNA processing protein RimM